MGSEVVQRIPYYSLRALKNAAEPVVTVFVLLAGGSAVTESVFAIPGLGQLTVDAILRGNFPIILGIALHFSFVYMPVTGSLTSHCLARNVAGC